MTRRSARPVNRLLSQRLNGRGGLALAALALLGACAALPRTDAATEQRWLAHRQAVERVDRWTLNGRIALRQEQEAWYASLHWQQQGQDFDIRLNSPLGSGVVAIQGGRSGIVMRLPQGKTLTARDADTLLYRELGWHMPLDGLYYWVRGLPQPDIPFSKELDAQGRLVALRQAGWSIRFLGYADAGGVQLPGKVFLESEPLSVRLVVQDWVIQARMIQDREPPGSGRG